MTVADSDATPELEQVYRRHVEFVWRTVRRLGVEDEAIEDVVHDVFLVLQRRLADYDGRASMRAWLYGIARRVARNHVRGRMRARRRLRLLAPPATPPDPEIQATQAQASRLVDRFLAQLDSKKREVFELADLEGMRGLEIAEALGVKLHTVYSRLRAARQQLASFVKREIGDPAGEEDPR
jgi:RNA polymerase sigma-70 factor (ECF subfamily)